MRPTSKPSPRNHFALPTCSARSGASWCLAAQISILRHQASQRRANGCPLSRNEGRGGGAAGSSLRGRIGTRRAGAAPGRARPNVAPPARPKSSRGISTPVVSLSASGTGSVRDGADARGAPCERRGIPAPVRLNQGKNGLSGLLSGQGMESVCETDPPPHRTPKCAAGPLPGSSAYGQGCHHWSWPRVQAGTRLACKASALLMKTATVMAPGCRRVSAVAMPGRPSDMAAAIEISARAARVTYFQEPEAALHEA